jgi:LacI family transcriptional regulator
MKKVTMQTIADTLNISRVSVWKVFNDQPGVSESLRATILTTAKELGYFLAEANPVLPLQKPTNTIPTISVVVSRPDSATFWMKIIHQIAEDFNDIGYNLLYTYLPSKFTEGYVLPPNLTNSNVDGIIVLNVYDEKIMELLTETGIPTVFLDTSPTIQLETICGDLFLLEGEYTISQITTSLLTNGCKRIGFIGDIHYSRTNEERYYGYMNALKLHNIKQDSNICLTRSMGITNYINEVKEFLNSVEQMPDAFICVSDHIAKVAYDYFTQIGYRVPDQILLSGYDGISDYFSDPTFLTTAEVDTKQLGRRLVNQLIYRVQYPNAPYEITHIMPKIRYGISTLSPAVNMSR